MEIIQDTHRAYLEFKNGRKYSFTKERFPGEYSCINGMVRNGYLKKIGLGDNARYERTDKPFYPSVKWIVGKNPGITKQRLIELKCNRQNINSYISKKNLILNNGGLYLPSGFVSEYGTNELSSMFNSLLMPVRAKWVDYGRNAKAV